MEAGLELLEQAVDKDPYFGRAWSALGGTQLVMVGRIAGPGASPEERQRAGVLRSMGISSMKRALEICPTIGYAYKIVVPAYEGIDNESIDQEMQWRDALAMDPNDASMLRQYAFQLMQHGLNEEAVEVLQRAYDIEPLMAMIPHFADSKQFLNKTVTDDKSGPMLPKAAAPPAVRARRTIALRCWATLAPYSVPYTFHASALEILPRPCPKMASIAARRGPCWVHDARRGYLLPGSQ